ncbi:MAG TPA: hypothetical protein VF519_09560 [Mycobacteriales bacterium]
MFTGDCSYRVVAGALAFLGLIACSKPTAGPLPSHSPGATATTSASPTAVAGADLVRAATHFYDVLEVASRDPATGADDVAALIASGCSCLRIVEFLRAEGRKGHRIERPVELRDARAAVAASGGGTVFATLAEGAGRVVDAHGRMVERLVPKTSRIVIDLVPQGGTFRVSQIAVSDGG